MPIVYSPGAMRDLRGIAARAGPATVRAIRARIDYLERFPKLGRPGKRNTRELVISRPTYPVIYRLHERHVEILRIRHGARRR